jgi:hypothetical protein
VTATSEAGAAGPAPLAGIALGLGWQIAEEYRRASPTPGKPPTRQASLPSLSDLTAAQRTGLALAQINATITKLNAQLTAGGLPTPTTDKVEDAYRVPGGSRDALRNAVYDLHLELLRALQAADPNLGAAYRLALPWLAVAPPRSVQIYRVADRPTLDMDPEALGRQPVIQRLYQPEHDLLAILTEERSRPRFATSTHLDGHNHHLHIAYWVSEQGLLFISTDRPSALAELLAKAGVTGAPLIGAADLRRLLAATNATRFFNVGLRELRPRQAFNASYETLAGAHADAAVGPDDIENKLLGHAMGRVGNGTGTFGISTAKGKYWEPARAASLFEFREWCAACARNVTTGAGSPTALHRLRIAERIVRYPKHPIAATLNESLLAGNWSLMLHQREIAPVDIDIHPEQPNESQIRLTLIDGGSPPAIVTANVNGTFEAEPNAYALDLETGELTSLAVRLQFAPPTIYFGDGSAVIGSASSTPKIEAGTDPPEFAVGLGWAGVNLAVETGDAGPGHINIQEFARRRAARDATWLITDHGTGELADLIAITVREGATTVEFVHCKGTKKPPGGRVEDLYDVIGQALRSTRHCRESESVWRELNKRLDSRASTKVLEGDTTTLKEALSRWSDGEAPVTSFKVTAAQPGLLLAETGTRASVRQLLFAANTHCFAQGIQLQLWCNDGT